MSPKDLPITAAEAFSLVSQRMEAVGQAPYATLGKGNRNKRLRFDLSGSSVDEIATLVGGKAGPDVRWHVMPSPAKDLRRVGADHLWLAIETLRDATGVVPLEPVGLEVLVDEAFRLPLAKVFSLAATTALGFEVEAAYFSSNEYQLACSLIAEAGYQIVPQETANATEELPASAEDQVWIEGMPKLVTHLRRERKRGLAKAKKAAFIRKNGALWCERCLMNPLIVFGDAAGEASIEVHHRATHVADMENGRATKLEDVQCLCANCHRYVHSFLKLALAHP